VRQKYNKTACEYMKQFRGTHNKCYNLTIVERDLVDLAFAGLASYLKEKMEGQEFLDMNQVMQKAMAHENWARDHRSYSRFRENGAKEKEKHDINCVDGDSASGDEDKICVTK
jgi:hypothetical protein